MAASTDSLRNGVIQFSEGNFVPVVEGSTTPGSAAYTVQTGSVTRLGNGTLITMNFAFTGHTGVGLMRISGLPAVPKIDGYPFAVYANGLNIGAGKTLQAYTAGGKVNLEASDPSGTLNVLVPMSANVGYLSLSAFIPN